MEFKHTLDNIEFNVIWNPERIMKRINREMKEFEYYDFYTTGDIKSSLELSKDVYDKNIKNIDREYENIIKKESLISLIELADKKQNGTFHKNKVVKEIYSKNSIKNLFKDGKKTGTFWKFNSLKVKAIDDKTLEISYEQRTLRL